MKVSDREMLQSPIAGPKTILGASAILQRSRFLSPIPPPQEAKGGLLGGPGPALKTARAHYGLSE